METTTNYKMIDCPEHPGKHKAILYQEGHEYAGIWECPKTGASDSCEHADTETEEVVTYFPTQQQIDTNTDHDEIHYISVCVDCGVTVDENIEPEEPDYDRDDE